MKRYIILALFSVFFIACGDSNTTVTAKNCSNSCDTEWQVCNEGTQKCEPKTDRCDTDELCKDNETKPKCNLVTHVCVADKCSDSPCDANTENGNTNCNLDDTTEGFSCICEEGFEFNTDKKCVEVVVNPCDAEPCKDNAEGKTVCKVDTTATDGYICEKPAEEDACTSEPCKDNSEGKTLCALIDSDPFYSCSCEEGFEYDATEKKCLEVTCTGTNECDNIDATKCDSDKLMKCVKDDTTYCTVWKEEKDCGAGLCKDDDNGNAICEVVCNDECALDDLLSCTGDRLFKCEADADGCLKNVEVEDCGAGNCVENNAGADYCACQECDPATFNQVCSEDVKSFEYCKEDNGCFTIETTTCAAGKHCEDVNNDNTLSCVDNTCSDAVECTSEDFTRCATSGGASILQGCEYNAGGCLELYTIETCADDMECQEYRSENQCVGTTNGTDKCQTADANNDAEVILSSGYWVGTTKDFEDKYKGCNNTLDGNDVVYAIDLLADDILKLELVETGSSINDITPSVYISKSCDSLGAADTCKQVDANNNGKAKLKFTALSAGKYFIFIDRKKEGSGPGGVIPDTTNGYEFELKVDLQ